MTDRVRDLGEGVLYARTDCAGTWRRLVAASIDGGLFGVFAIVTFVWSGFVFGGETAVWIGLLTCFVAGVAYFAVLKRSFPTLGHLVAGVRVVGLDGEPAGYWAMFLRFTIGALWAFTGSAMAIIDLLWISGDEQCQSLRDKIAGTLVVKRGAMPLARGRQTMRLYTFLGFALYLREVKPHPEIVSDARRVASG